MDAVVRQVGRVVTDGIFCEVGGTQIVPLVGTGAAAGGIALFAAGGSHALVTGMLIVTALLATGCVPRTTLTHAVDVLIVVGIAGVALVRYPAMPRWVLAVTPAAAVASPVGPVRTVFIATAAATVLAASASAPH